MYHGIINIYKEPGFTSFDVVAKLRKIAGQKKIGHTGTLDPDAEGVLPVCLGSATKVCDLLTDRTKTYVAKMRLGLVTDTQDGSGTVLSEVSEEQIRSGFTEDAVREAVLSFVGAYDQVPPMYSALKVNGRKLYELAREGKSVERKARRVTIETIDIRKIDLPYVEMEVTCSKGTYIRTLCEDIGNKLGCGGCMMHLLRTRVGEFELGEARKLSEVSALAEEGRLHEALLSADRLFLQYDAFTVKDRALRLLLNGNRLTAEDFTAKPAQDTIRVYLPDGRFFALYEKDASKADYRPLKIFKED